MPVQIRGILTSQGHVAGQNPEKSVYLNEPVCTFVQTPVGGQVIANEHILGAPTEKDRNGGASPDSLKTNNPPDEKASGKVTPSFLHPEFVKLLRFADGIWFFGVCGRGGPLLETFKNGFLRFGDREQTGLGIYF